MFNRINGVVNLHLPSKAEPVFAEIDINATTGEISIIHQNNEHAEKLLKFLSEADLRKGICITLDVMD